MCRKYEPFSEPNSSIQLQTLHLKRRNVLLHGETKKIEEMLAQEVVTDTFFADAYKTIHSIQNNTQAQYGSIHLKRPIVHLKCPNVLVQGEMKKIEEMVSQEVVTDTDLRDETGLAPYEALGLLGQDQPASG